MTDENDLEVAMEVLSERTHIGQDEDDRAVSDQINSASKSCSSHIRGMHLILMKACPIDSTC